MAGENMFHEIFLVNSILGKGRIHPQKLIDLKWRFGR